MRTFVLWVSPYTRRALINGAIHVFWREEKHRSCRTDSRSVMRKSCTETAREKGARKCSRCRTCWLWGWRPCKMKREESGTIGCLWWWAKRCLVLTFLFSQRLFKRPRRDGRSWRFLGRRSSVSAWSIVGRGQQRETLFPLCIMNRWRQQSICGRFVIIDFRARDTYVEPSRLFIFLSIIYWVIYCFCGGEMTPMTQTGSFLICFLFYYSFNLISIMRNMVFRSLKCIFDYCSAENRVLNVL